MPEFTGKVFDIVQLLRYDSNILVFYTKEERFMKKLLASLLALSFVLTVPALAVGYEDILPGELMLAGEKQVYAEASDASEVVAACAAGDLVEVLAAEEGWVNVALADGTEGWITAEGVSSSCYWTEENMQYVVSVGGMPVSLFKRAEEGSTSINTTFTGVIVERVGEEKNGFVKVQIGGTNGYILVSALSAEKPCDPPVTLLASSVDGVALKSGVSANGKTIATLPGATEVVLLNVRSDGWCQILVDGITGYVKNTQLSPVPKFGMRFDGIGAEGTDSVVSSVASNEAIVCNPNASDTLSLRKRPEIGSPSLGEYYNGTIVTLIEEPDKGWVKVSVNGQAEGYVQLDYLAMSGQKVASAQPRMVIDNRSGSGLNMREKPDTNGKKIELFKNGTEVIVLGQAKNGWYHVQIGDQTGFMQDRLSEIK